MIGDLIKPSQVPPQENRRRRRGLFQRRWFRWFMGIAAVFGVAALIAGYSLITHYKKKATTFDLTKLGQLEKSSLIYDRNGDEIGQFFVKENRRPIALSDVPPSLINALVAEEDSRFYDHHGVDYMGILRAMKATLLVGHLHQGASTITQQLARQGLDLEKGKNIDRKFTEIFIARRIEEMYTKQQILELYLNRIYFGGGFYGINAASLGYFNKPASQLTVEESAMLCGLIKSPNRCSPFHSMKEATSARDHVLDRMREERFLSDQEYRRLLATPIKTNPGRLQGTSGYVQSEVRQQLIDLLGAERAGTGGYRVNCTDDNELQNAAQKSVSDRLLAVETGTPGYKHQTQEQYREKLAAFVSSGHSIDDKDCPRPQYLQGALVMIDNPTGAILAMVGGRDFTQSQYNRVMAAKRSVGTAFTPLVFGAAFENGAFPGTTVKDTPLDNTRVMIGAITGILGEWGSEDPNVKFRMDDITARQALVWSRNGCTVRIGAEMGLEKLKDFAGRAGVRAQLKPENKTYLGSSEVTPAEMALAYSTFAGAGRRPQQLFLITKIEDAEGNLVYASKTADADPKVVTDEFTAWQVHSCLAQALTEGPGAAATRKYELGDIPAAAKTGTHSNFTDVWTIGYTSRVTCAVWAGMDKPGTIFENAFGSQIALPIWCDAMKVASATYPGEVLQPPPNADTVEICSHSGMRATDNCYETAKDEKGILRFVRTTYREYVRPGFKVSGACTFHSKHPDGEAPVDIMPPLAIEPSAIRGLGSNDAALATARPVMVMTPAVLTENDPYQSIRPVLRIPKASRVDDEGEVAAKPSTPELSPAHTIDKEKGRIDLAPPPAVKLD